MATLITLTAAGVKLLELLIGRALRRRTQRWREAT